MITGVTVAAGKAQAEYDAHLRALTAGGAMTQKEADQRLAVAQLRAAVPMMEAIAEDVVRRKLDGSLDAEIRAGRLTSLINSMTKIIAAFKKTGVVIVNPGSSAPRPAEPTALRSRSAIRMTDAERAKLRAEAEEAEVVPESPENP